MPHSFPTRRSSVLHLQDREHEILFAKSRSPFHPQLLRHGDEFGGRFLLEVFQMHQCRSGKGMLRNLPLYAFLGKEFSCADGREGGQRYAAPDQNGRAPCRERVCQSVWITVDAGTLKKKI